MNEKLKTFLRNAWNEPRRFFFWLTVISCTGIAVGYIINIGTHNVTPSSGIERIGWIVAACLVVCVVVGFLGFILSWIQPVHRFFVQALHRRFFLLACFATVIALFYTEENWRGSHDWKQFKREREAKGEKLSMAELAPAAVPDDQNFAMQPIWVEEISGMMGFENAKKWYGDKLAALGHTNRVRSLEMPLDLYSKSLEFTNRDGDWQKAEKTDLILRQDYYRWLSTITNVFPVAPQPQTPAKDVLLALSKYDSALEKLHTASKLPYSRFPVGYTDDHPAAILLPHLASLKGCVRVLELRAVAELQSGQTEKASEDIGLMFRLIAAVEKEPIMISHLVRIAMLQLAMQPIWEGLADHKWTEAQLVSIETELGKIDFLAAYDLSMQGERTGFGVAEFDFLRRNRGQIEQVRKMIRNFPNPPVTSGGIVFEQLREAYARLIPGGWFEQNKITLCRLHEEYILPIVDMNTRTVSPTAAKRCAEVLEKLKVTPYNLFGPALTHVLNRVAVKSARAQVVVDEGRVACALERYRLARGKFPEMLDELSPQFMQKIPHDVVGGKPLKYWRTDDGKFILYSVGWNEMDDGGIIALTGEGKIMDVFAKSPPVDELQGDWVWQIPK